LKAKETEIQQLKGEVERLLGKIPSRHNQIIDGALATIKSLEESKTDLQRELTLTKDSVVEKQNNVRLLNI
jgi:hypothetical protein